MPPAPPTTCPAPCACTGAGRAALRRALDRIVARHEALRTTFVRSTASRCSMIAPGRPAVCRWSSTTCATWMASELEALARAIAVDEAQRPVRPVARAADPRPADAPGRRRARAAGDHAPHRLRRLVDRGAGAGAGGRCTPPSAAARPTRCRRCRSSTPTTPPGSAAGCGEVLAAQAGLLAGAPGRRARAAGAADRPSAAGRADYAGASLAVTLTRR